MALLVLTVLTNKSAVNSESCWRLCWSWLGSLKSMKLTHYCLLFSMCLSHPSSVPAKVCFHDEANIQEKEQKQKHLRLFFFLSPRLGNSVKSLLCAKIKSKAGPDSRWGDTISWREEFKDRLWRILVKKSVENCVHFCHQSITQVNQTLVYFFWCQCLIKRAKWYDIFY